MKLTWCRYYSSVNVVIMVVSDEREIEGSSKREDDHHKYCHKLSNISLY